MTACDSISYLGYLNKSFLVILIIPLLVRNLFLMAVPFFSEEFKSSHKAPKFSFGGRVKISKHANVFIKAYIRNWSRNTFVIDSELNTNPWKFVINDSNKENN